MLLFKKLFTKFSSKKVIRKAFHRSTQFTFHLVRFYWLPVCGSWREVKRICPKPRRDRRLLSIEFVVLKRSDLLVYDRPANSH